MQHIEPMPIFLRYIYLLISSLVDHELVTRMRIPAFRNSVSTDRSCYERECNITRANDLSIMNNI